MRKIYLPLPLTILLALWVATAAYCGERGEQRREGSWAATTKPDLTSAIRFIGNFSFFDHWLPYNRSEIIFGKGAPCVATFQRPGGQPGQWIVDFSKLNPDSVQVVENEIVQVRTTNAELLIRYERYGKASQTMQYLDRLYTPEPSLGRAVPAATKRRIPIDQAELRDTLRLYVRNAEDVSKVRDALVYVIKRCGGKVDLFGGT